MFEHAAATMTDRTVELAQQLASLPAHAVELARQANSAIVAASPVPKVNPSAPPGSEKVLKIVGWAGWGVFIASLAGVLFICIKMATSAHRTRMGDGGGEEAGKLFWPLLACIVGSSAGGILGAVA